MISSFSHTSLFFLDSKRNAIILFAKKKTPYEFNDGSDIQADKTILLSGETKMNNNPAANATGVQFNTNINRKTGTPNRSNKIRNNNNGNNLNHGGINMTKYSPINLSSILVSKKIVNRNLLTTPARFSSQENIDLRFTIKPFASHLEKQSITWASKIDVTSEIDKYRIFGRERFQGEYVQKLQQIYIYSYYKCLLLGINEYRIDQTSDSDHCLVGHSIMYQMLYKRSYSFEVNGVFVNYIFEFSREDYDFILQEAKKYEFINSAISDIGSRFNILNTTIERYIESLRHAISESSCDVLFIRLSDATKLHDFTSCATLPLANSFWSCEWKKWYYCYHEYAQLNGNTVLFGKSNFITIKDIDLNTLRDFEFAMYSLQQDILIKYEVSCIGSSKYYDCNLDKSQLVPKNYRD